MAKHKGPNRGLLIGLGVTALAGLALAVSTQGSMVIPEERLPPPLRPRPRRPGAAPTMADYREAIKQGRGVRLGDYFNLGEFLTSGTAFARNIPNVMPAAQEGKIITNLRYGARTTLDPLRRALGPVTISGGWRSPALNDAIGGSRLCTGKGFPGNKAPDSMTALRNGCGSQHMLGEGADVKVKGYPTSRALAKAIMDLKQRGLIDYDQMVWYDPTQSGHVHLSWTRRRPHRNKISHKNRAGRYDSQLPA